MSRRLRRGIVIAAAVFVLAVGGAFAAFALRGGDQPPPPTLSSEATATATPAPEAGTSAWEVAASRETFVGYRVREEFIGIGVKDAVGRTGDVSGTVDVETDAITAAALEADLTTLVSDEARRDSALRDRGIETNRFPGAEFRLTDPVELSRRERTVAGELTLHGETQLIEVKVSAQRLGGDAIELVGSAPIPFREFNIEPPSVAGFVTVEDRGTLEFKLRLRRAS